MKVLTQLLVCFLVLILAGCDSSDNPKQGAVSPSAKVTGVVTEHDEPVTQGKIFVKDAKGNVVGSTELKGTDDYSVSVSKNATYPLVLEIKVDDSVLEAVIMDPKTVQQDISSMSTLIVASARDLGGFNKQNMSRAAINAIRQSKKASGSGTSAGFKGDPTKQYGGWH